MRKFAALFLFAALCAPAADPTLLKLAMPDARVVAGINVAQARNTPFGRFVLAQISAGGPDFDQFVQATGFDPRTSLDEILFATPGGPGNSQKLVLARGTFTPSQIVELARSAGAIITNYQGVDVIANSANAAAQEHGGVMWAAFLDNSIAVAGDEQSVRAAIDRRQSGPGLSRDLAAKANDLSAAQDAWFISLVPVSEFAAAFAGPGQAGNPAMKTEALKSIQQASGGVKFGDAVNLGAELISTTVEDAKSLADVLRFFTGFAMMAPVNPGQPRPADLLKTLSITPQGNVVKLSLAIPETQIEQLVNEHRL